VSAPAGGSEAGGPDVGRLLEALTRWFGADHGGLPLANGSPECRICPVCQALTLVRGARPEVVEHLTVAAAALVDALRAAVEGHEHAWAAGPDRTAERVDIGD